MTKTWEPLAWDSNFFGLQVARLDAGLGAEQLRPTIGELREAGIALAYWMLERPDEARATAARAEGGVLVDDKTTFLATVEHVLASTAGSTAEVKLSSGPASALEPLALAAGTISRFRVDQRLPKGMFEKLYSIWLARSLSGEIASAVYVTEEPAPVLPSRSVRAESRTDSSTAPLPLDSARGGASVSPPPTGFITVGVKSGRADIGLIAVDARARGKGCGTALVRRAALWAREAGIKNLQVVTQGANREACALYERCGFTRETVSPVFHFWLQSDAR